MTLEAEIHKLRTKMREIARMVNRLDGRYRPIICEGCGEPLPKEEGYTLWRHYNQMYLCEACFDYEKEKET